MPFYKYSGYGPDGGRASGTIEAEGPKDAATRLKAKGVHPRQVREHTPGRRLGFGSDAGRLPALTRQLSVLVRAGVPLLEALRALGGESPGAWRAAVLGVRERVMGGASLERALSDYPELFPEFYRSMVGAGERAGALDRVLENLASYLEGEQDIREKLRSAMLYPLIVMGVGLIVLVLLFTYVVPKIVVLFENARAALPLSTRILIAVSGFMGRFWWLLIPALAAGAWGLGRLRARRRVQFDRAAYGLFSGLYLSRFALTLSFLLEGGLPMLRALDLAGRSSGNAYLAGIVSGAALRVSEGATLAQSLEGLPPVLLELVATGERTGELASVLRHAASGYKDEFDLRVKRALTFLGPGMILLMGLVVGYIVYAVLLPLFELNQLVR